MYSRSMEKEISFEEGEELEEPPQDLWAQSPELPEEISESPDARHEWSLEDWDPPPNWTMPLGPSCPAPLPKRWECRRCGLQISLPPWEDPNDAETEETMEKKCTDRMLKSTHED